MTSKSESPQTAFVLVHGAWHGAWCWRRLLPLLRGAGVETHAVTLTGVGERAHLLSPAVDLHTHIQDVCGLIEAEELQRIVLVGHSYAGVVVTGVADRLQRDHPGLLAHLVYLDAALPYPGDSWSSHQSQETRQARIDASKPSGGLSFPPPDASVFGLEGADRDWVNRRQTPQPFRLYQQPLDFDGARVAAVPRTFIDCTSPALPTIAPARQRARSEPGWQVLELATGHDPMVSEPRKLADMLLGIHRGTQP
ncbi:alpha/beta fold hydrolase [Hydrogenophaga sp. BPS33]|uniref:alpha/beta fold hydrolase n=1 Tax=Hydrogenophaga sp. BPS33 TaxID=2651974 RepID=UPI00131FC4F2|nr:alpha/beta hydrolase [Hydrogenophaga sp. BPS33]QHE86030.1 alpha/beta hydrolase [Hydrogenophaga sp. BPS33]